MNALAKAFATACALLVSVCAVAQRDTVRLTVAQVEAVFMRQNLQLIAERLNIEMADAAIVQARLWNNPTLTIEEVNLWSSEGFREEMDGMFPPGTVNRQVIVGVEQVIATGGKRRKLVEVERVSREMAAQYFEEVLLGLKAELRTTCAELLYLQHYRGVLESQLGRLSQLIAGYRRQVQEGNVSAGELLRLQAALLEVQSELNEVQKESNAQQRALRTLLNMATPVHIYLVDEDATLPSPQGMQLTQLIDLSAVTRPDLRHAALQADYHSRVVSYEKAQRIPDLTLIGTYDRAGSVGPNFVGVGVSFDLPFFNRNQGAIKIAMLEHQQSLTEAELLQTSAYNEVLEAWDNYKMAYSFNRQIAEELVANLDEFLENTTRNFVNRNIGIVEFLDFFEAYKDNKRTMLNAQKEARVAFEELQLSVGTEIN